MLSAGQLDPTFGNSGVVELPTRLERITGMGFVESHLDSAGRLLTITNDDYGEGSTLTRYLADGTLDTALGQGGRVPVILGSKFAPVTDFVVLSDDSIIVAGVATSGGNNGNSHGVILKLAPDGTVDTSFGNDGRIWHHSVYGESSPLLRYPDDRFLAITKSSTTTRLTRFFPDGRIDETYGVDGHALTPDARSFHRLRFAAPHFFDDVLLFYEDNSGKGLVTRYSNGEPDNAFGAAELDSKTEREFSVWEDREVEVDSKGRILLAHVQASGPDPKVVVTRFGPDGILDASYGVDGRVVAPTHNPAFGVDISVSGSGAATILTEVALGDIRTLRISSPGFLESESSIATDGSLQIGGLSTLGVDPHAFVRTWVDPNNPNGQESNRTALTLYNLADGSDEPKAFVEGREKFTGHVYDSVSVSSEKTLVLAQTEVRDEDRPGIVMSRLMKDGTLDTSYGEMGSILLPISAIELQGGLRPQFLSDSDGIYVLGELELPVTNGTGVGDHTVRVARLRLDGGIDESFGENGWLAIDLSDHFEDGSDRLFSATVRPNGGFDVLGGHVYEGVVKAIRISPEGTVERVLEDAFAANAPRNEFRNDFSRLCTDDDGSTFALLGDANNALFETHLYKLTPSGEADITFGTNGRVKTALKTGQSSFHAAVFCNQNDNVLIAGTNNGSSPVTRDAHIVLESFGPNGERDQSFGLAESVSNGLVEWKVPDAFGIEGRDFEVDEFGRVIVAASILDEYETDFAALRFHANGHSDRTFGQNGVWQLGIGDYNDDVVDVSVTSTGEIFLSGTTDSLTGTQPVLVKLASGPPSAWQNIQNPLDTRLDGEITPLDALVVINELNADRGGPLPVEKADGTNLFFDANGDGEASPLDALLVINWLNLQPASPSAALSAGAVSTSAEFNFDPQYLNNNPFRSDGLRHYVLRDLVFGQFGNDET